MTTFKVGATVIRDPKIWRKDTKLFTVREVRDGMVWIAPKGVTKEKCLWTGKMIPISAVPYQASELRAW